MVIRMAIVIKLLKRSGAILLSPLTTLWNGLFNPGQMPIVASQAAHIACQKAYFWRRIAFAAIAGFTLAWPLIFALIPAFAFPGSTWLCLFIIYVVGGALRACVEALTQSQLAKAKGLPYNPDPAWETGLFGYSPTDALPPPSVPQHPDSHNTSDLQLDATVAQENTIALILLFVAVAIAFALYAVSFLAVPGEFLMVGFFGHLWAPFVLLGLGIAVYSQFIVRFVRRSVSETAAGHGLEAALKLWEALELESERQINAVVDARRVGGLLLGNEQKYDEPSQMEIDFNSPNKNWWRGHYRGNSSYRRIDDLSDDPGDEGALMYLGKREAFLLGADARNGDYVEREDSQDQRDERQAEFDKLQDALGNAPDETSNKFLRYLDTMYLTLSDDLRAVDWIGDYGVGILERLHNVRSLHEKRNILCNNVRALMQITCFIAGKADKFRRVFSEDNQEASFKIDPDRKPIFGAARRNPIGFEDEDQHARDAAIKQHESSRNWLIAIAMAFLAASVTVFFLIFIGQLKSFWFAPLGSILGLVALIAGREVLRHTSAGPYGEWVAILSAASCVLFMIGMLTLGGGFGLDGIGHIPMPSLLAGVMPMLLMNGVLLIPLGFMIYKARRYANGDPAYRAEVRKKAWAGSLLKLFKIALIVGLLFLLFVNVGFLFNLTDIGVISRLGDIVGDIIHSAFPGGGGSVLGLQWAAVFSIMISAACIAGAALLLKNVLQKSPTKPSDLKEHGTIAAEEDRWFSKFWLKWGPPVKIVAAQLFKLVFTLGPILFLSTVPTFLPGGMNELFVVFGIVATVIPLFSGNAKLGHLSNGEQKGRFARFNRWWNNCLGVAQLKDRYNTWKWYVLRELGVLNLVGTLPVVISFLVFGGGALFLNATIVFIIAAMVNTGIRWVRLFSDRVSRVRSDVGADVVDGVEEPFLNGIHQDEEKGVGEDYELVSLSEANQYQPLFDETGRGNVSAIGIEIEDNLSVAEPALRPSANGASEREPLLGEAVGDDVRRIGFQEDGGFFSPVLAKETPTSKSARRTRGSAMQDSVVRQLWGQMSDEDEEKFSAAAPAPTSESVEEWRAYYQHLLKAASEARIQGSQPHAPPGNHSASFSHSHRRTGNNVTPRPSSSRASRTHFSATPLRPHNLTTDLEAVANSSKKGRGALSSSSSQPA